MAKRTTERAAQVLDRAARMQSFKPGLLDRRMFDRQMRTPGHVEAPFNVNKVAAAGLLKRGGVQDVPLSKIRTEQPTISLAAAKDKLLNPTTKSGALPQLIYHKGLYYAADGNHRITAARALGEGTVKAGIHTLTADVKPPSNIGKTLGNVSAFAGPAMVAANATLAYNAKLANGGTQAQAVGSAAATGTLTAASGVAVGGAVKAIDKVGLLKGTAAVAGRAAVPLSIAGHAAAYGIAAARRGEDGLGVLKAAGWGAVNGVVPVDLTLSTMKSFGNSGRTDTASPARLTPGQAQQFQKASADYEHGHAHMGQQGEAGNDPTAKRVGWSNAARMASAQSRGVKWNGPTE